ncbi:MAG: serine kinase [Brevundimonas sp.]|nr:MAG: serine kinase [Brevundimonas sp.]
MRQTVHATTVARFRSGWRGVLLLGPSGAGKSDLALRLIGAGWRLVADDQTLVWGSGGRLFGAAPQRLHGLIEARGVGLIAAPALALSPLSLAVHLQAAAPERLPEPETWAHQGLALPLIRLDAAHASAVDKIAAALAAI